MCQQRSGHKESNCIPSSGIFGEVATVLDVLGLLTVLSEAVCCPQRDPLLCQNIRPASDTEGHGTYPGPMFQAVLCIHISMYMSIYLYICIYICIYIYMYIYIYM